jgi:hypothetical protein
MYWARERIRHRDGQDFSDVYPVSKASLMRVKLRVSEDPSANFAKVVICVCYL